MAVAPLKICAEIGCKATGTKSRCDQHALKERRDREARRPKDHNKDYNSTEWKQERKEYLEENPFCEWLLDDGSTCNQIAKHVDHKETLRAGGRNDKRNYQALCHSHHSHKTAKYDGGFGNKKRSA
ncbi:MAG: HNH endonuclease [Candidatus Obscuribacterales bacterium]|nr:HNH endonuclease [Candidatus Obscuribacterales bacterium]